MSEPQGSPQKPAAGTPPGPPRGAPPADMWGNRRPIGVRGLRESSTLTTTGTATTTPSRVYTPQDTS